MKIKIPVTNITFKLFLVFLFGFGILVVSTPSAIQSADFKVIATLLVFELLFIIPIIMFMVNIKNGVFMSEEGFKISYLGKKIFLNWNDIKKVGFQAIVSKKSNWGQVVIPYLAIDLKDDTKIIDLKSSKMYGFLLKKEDLKSFSDNENISSLYVSCKELAESNSNLPDFLANKVSFIANLKPISINYEN